MAWWRAETGKIGGVDGARLGCSNGTKRDRLGQGRVGLGRVGRVDRAMHAL